MISATFTEQLSFENNGQVVEEFITKWLMNTADKIAKDETSPIGCLIVLVNLSQANPTMEGMRSLKPKQNPIKTMLVANSKDGAKYLREYSQSPYDGAIVINKDGQILGAGMYLMVEDPSIEIPDGCGTRHMAAADFSLQSNVISVLTLSEETNTVRIWKNGKIVREELFPEIKKGI